jgi:predicted O-methyltransferase YrrM
MNRSITGLGTPIANYLDGLLPPEPAVCAALRAETAALPEARMQISHDQARFMQLLLRAIGARNTLEIGVFTGYSTLITAAALPPVGRVIACDVSVEWTDIARRHWQAAGVAGRIDLRIAPALQTLDGLIADGLHGSFDFAFIDADKRSYAAYFERCLTLLRPDGLILFDNALWDGRVADASNQEPDTIAIRAVNRLVAADPRVDAYLAVCGDGIHLARKK